PGAPRGNGLALDNIRGRLQARYGPDARFELLPAPAVADGAAPGVGTLSRITLPLHPATP
ncbi:MAG: hypothetical protein RL227_1426, partial [Pseudomonadota bacterium]